MCRRRCLCPHLRSVETRSVSQPNRYRAKARCSCHCTGTRVLLHRVLPNSQSTWKSGELTDPMPGVSCDQPGYFRCPGTSQPDLFRGGPGAQDNLSDESREVAGNAGIGARPSPCDLNEERYNSGCYWQTPWDHRWQICLRTEASRKKPTYKIDKEKPRHPALSYPWAVHLHELFFPCHL